MIFRQGQVGPLLVNNTALSIGIHINMFYFSPIILIRISLDNKKEIELW